MDWNTLNEWLFVLRGRISPTTVIAAIVAAGGVVIALVGLWSIRRVSLEDEAVRISGIQESSQFERWQMRLNQSGLRLKLWEFVVIGLLIGALFGAVLLAAGFLTMGLVMLPLGPIVYYRFLMHRRNKEMRAFREQLPDAIYDFVQFLAMKKDVALAVQEMAAKGPLAVRSEFHQADSLIRRKTPVAAALEAVGQGRSEVFFRQFMDALAQHELNGGDLRTVLGRIARGQRSQLRLQDRIMAQQAGARFVGLVYGVAPFVFLLFMRLMGGDWYARFYQTPFGQVAQVLVLGSGLATWWLTNKIARRGIYMDDRPDAPQLAAHVRRIGFEKPIATM